MIETPQSLLGPGGECALPRLVDAGRGPLRRPRTSAPTTTPRACGITAAHQDARAPGLRLRAARSCRSRCARHGDPPLRRGDQRACRSRRTARRRAATSRRADRARTTAWCTARGGCTTTTSAARSRAASTRAGTCTRRSCPRATRRSTPSSSKGSTPPGRAAAQLRREGRAGDARRRRLRRRGDRAGAAELLPARRSRRARSPRSEAVSATALSLEELRGRSFAKITEGRRRSA